MLMRSRLLLVLVALFVASAPSQAQTDDPLLPILAPELRPSVQTFIENYRANRPYQLDDFPLPPEGFATFRDDIIARLTKSLDLEHWVVDSSDKPNTKPHLFRDRLLKKIRHHGIEMEVHLIELLETGDKIPAVICLPNATEPRPGVAVFSGHSRNGLHDLVVDLDRDGLHRGSRDAGRASSRR